MQYEEHPYEETIDLAALVAAVLRGWKWLLAAILVGAVLTGGYRFLAPAEPVVDEEQITELQTALDTNKASLDTNTTEIANNTAAIQADGEKISANEELLETYRADQGTLEQTRAALQESLDAVREVLANSGTITEEAASVIVQLPTLTNDIADTSVQIQEAAQKIQTAENEITAWQAEIESLTARSDTLTQTNADLQEEIAEQEQELAALQEGTPGSKPIGKSALLGALLGAFVYCCVILIRFMTEKRLQSAKELQERYGFPIFGEFYSEKAKSHGKFDRFLDKLSGDMQTLPEEQDVYQLAAAGIAASVQGSVLLAVTGTVGEELLEQVCSALTPLLPDGCTVEAQPNPVYHAAFLAKLRDYTILLVEGKGVSEKEETAKLMELLKRTGVPVVGAVVR